MDSGLNGFVPKITPMAGFLFIKVYSAMKVTL